MKYCNLCTIILPWEKYFYKCLPMRVSDSPGILLQKINKLFPGFEFIRTYIDNSLILKKVDWTDHVKSM